MNPTLTNSLKAGAWTALFSFVTLFSVTLLGWLQDVVVWASDSGVAEFPTLSVLGYGAVSAVAAAMIGLVNFGLRFIQGSTNLPGGPPEYTPPAGPLD